MSTTLSELAIVLFRDVFIGMILVVVVPTTILGVVSSGNLNLVNLLESIILMSVLQFLPNALNNHADWKIDDINGKRTRMHQIMSKKHLLLASLALFLITIPFLYYGNFYLKLTILIAYFFVFNYSHLIKAKNILFLNYGFIAFFYGSLAFAVGFFVSSTNFSNFLSLVWIPVFLFFIYLGMSVSKDYEDVKGDKSEGKMTIPVVFGKKISLLYQALLLTFSFTPVLYFTFIRSVWVPLIILVLLYLISIYCLNIVRSTTDKTKYHQAHNLIRIDALLVTISLSIFFLLNLI